MSTFDDYPYIVAWGRMMGSHRPYIRQQVEQARADGAPPNAIYRRDDGTWAITEEILRGDTRRQLGLDPLVPRQPDLAAILPELRNAILWTEYFRDLFGMTQVQELGDHTLLIQFSTGWSVRLTLKLQAPDPPL
jgi:hypothetical protein